MGALKYSRHFANVADLWAAAKQEPTSADAKAVWKRHITASSSGHSGYGLPKAELLAVVEKGWQDGASKVETFASKIKQDVPAPKSRRRKVKFSDSGDNLHITRVWAGQLDRAWESHPRQTSNHSQNVTIFARLWQVWSVSPETYFWRGAAALALADILTEQGYNVEILGVSIAHHAKGLGAYTCTIKAPDAPLEMNTLAATVSLVGFLRCALFSLYQHDGVDDGCGHLANETEFKRAQDELREQEGFAWDFDTQDVQDERSAREWCINAIRKLQGEEQQ